MYTNTHRQTHCFLSTLNRSWPLHLSSPTPLSDNSPHSATTVSQECHFSFLLAYYGFQDHSASPSIPPLTSLLLVLFIPFHSPHHYLSTLKLPKTRRCAEERKTKMGRALIPGIWESPFWPEQNEPRSLQFGQCYSCLSK